MLITLITLKDLNVKFAIFENYQPSSAHFAPQETIPQSFHNPSKQFNIKDWITEENRGMEEMKY